MKYIIAFQIFVVAYAGCMQKSRISTSRYDVDERRAMYPFNSASEIRLVSFCLNNTLIEPMEGCGLKRKDSVLLESYIVQSRTLSKTETDTLTDVLFNFCARSSDNQYLTASCYRPRNAIVFFNERKKLFEFIEICFECLQIRKSNETVPDPDLCASMYEELERYFNRLGIATVGD